MRRLLSALPQGSLLPEAAWQRRHRWIVVILWLHAAGLVAIGLGAGYGPVHVLFDVGAVGGCAAVAGRSRVGRRLGSVAAAIGLVTASAMLVHFWHGEIEAHFHFFVVIPVLALYQDWAPFLAALLYVVVHHGAVGVLDPRSVYNHGDAIAHPWKWALIHAVFVLGASAACLVSWRGNEDLLHEPLTGLPGRAVFIQSVGSALERLGRRRGRLAVIFVDLNRFKLFNDTLGHAFGDALLVAAAERLRGAVRSSDTVARLGGDEFAVLADGILSEDEARRIAGRVKDALETPFVIDGTTVVSGASVGLVCSGSASVTANELIADADAAMYRAKARPAEPFVVFDVSMREEDRMRLDTEESLRGAVGRGELRLAYQPIVAVAGRRVVGVEALLRWDHPERGAVPPGDFVPLAEQTGLIVPIGRWVLEEACTEATNWPAPGPGAPAPYVTVNVSGRQFAQPDFVATVAEVLEATGLEPARLGLEITESMLLADDDAFETIAALKTLGVRVLLDDFGTGYSSLAYLQRFPIDVLKVDRSFVAAAKDDRGSGMLAAVAGIGAAVGLEVVAEGVETGDEVTVLNELGYDLAQGYHFAVPSTPEALAALLHGERDAIAA